MHAQNILKDAKSSKFPVIGFTMEDKLGACKIKKGSKTWNHNFLGNTMGNLLKIFCSYYVVEFQIATYYTWKEAKCNVLSWIKGFVSVGDGYPLLERSTKSNSRLHFCAKQYLIFTVS